MNNIPSTTNNISVRRMVKKFLRPIYRYLCKLHANYDFYKYTYMGSVRAHYYRQLFKECGANLSINGKPIIYHAEKIHVGNNVTINSGVQLCPRGDIYIGNNVIMSRGSQITAGQLDVEHWVEEENKVHSHVSQPVYIADGTWLCVNSIVLPGVSIKGKGCIVAAGAVVTQDIEEDYIIVGGVPAKKIKNITKGTS